MIEKNEKYLQLMRKLIPINELPVAIQNEFISKAELLRLEKGKYLFKKGQQDGYAYYLLEGVIELQGDLEKSIITGGTKGSRYAMAQLQPRQFNALSLENSVVLRILRSQLDHLIVLYEKEQADSYGRDGDTEVSGVEVEDSSDGEDVDWMIRMLQSELFSRLPTSNIHTLFALLEPLDLKAGEVVIRQGEPGEYYYIIQEGKCQVSRKPRAGSKDINLAVMGPGDSFGEESLFTETNRNATVTMITDGIVMRLSKEDFFELIKKPILHEISYEDALCLVDIGTGEWIDVRFKNEHDEAAISGSRNIPLNMLRLEAGKLARDRQYVVYCDTGGRSLSAAFVLTGMGFDVSYLAGGLSSNPQAVNKPVTVIPAAPQPEEQPAPMVTPAPVPSEKAGQAQGKAVNAPAMEEESSAAEEIELTAAAPEPEPETSALTAPVPEPEITPQAAPASEPEFVIPAEEHAAEPALGEVELKIDGIQVNIDEEFMDDDIDPDVRASLLETELAKTNLKLMDTSRIIHIAETHGMRRAREELEDKLHKERIRIEVAKEAAELEARKLRELEEAKIIRKKEEAARLFQREKRKLEQIYLQKAEEMEKLQQLKHENEAHLRASREKLEKSMAEARSRMMEARKQLDAAQRMKAEVEKSRTELQQAETAQKHKQEELERKIQEEVKAKLAEERRIMAEQITTHQQELENYKTQKAAADAARDAARKEALQIIAEQKARHEKDKELVQQQMRRERLQLEAEQLKLQKTLLEIQQMKQSAEDAKQAALEEAGNLRRRLQQMEQSMGREIQVRVKEELKKAQDKINKARKEIAQAEQAQIRVVAARKVNAQNILKQKEHEEKIRSQVKVSAADGDSEKEKIRARIFSHQEKLKRIQERAAAAKQTAGQPARLSVLELEPILGRGKN